MYAQKINKGGWPRRRQTRLLKEVISKLEKEIGKEEAEVEIDIDEYGIEHPILNPPSIFYVAKNSLSAYNITQQGTSHIESGTRCQDRSGIRALPNEGIVIAAIADGVGNCSLSDIGADCAVVTVLDSLEQQLKKIELPLTGSVMGKILRVAMNEAYDTIKKKSEKLEVLMYSLQSTLTVCVYDGDTLFTAHAGDDGVVALLQDGKYHLVTVRHKGELENSVYPLQSKGTWQFGMTENVVACHTDISVTYEQSGSIWKPKYWNI